MASKEWTAPDILQLSSSYWTACALQAGVVLDVFTTLDTLRAEGKTPSAAELATVLSCEKRAFGMLVTALVSLGFLNLDGERILLPESSQRLLSAHSKEYIGFIVRHHAHLMHGWASLAEAVRTGQRTRDNSSSDTDNESEREAFLMGMFNVALHQADVVAEALDLSGKTRLLDLGGGPGTYAVFFCRHNPALRATIFDLPTSRAFAEKTVHRYNMADRVDFAGGNFMQDTLPSGYDVAWLSQILHGESPQDAAKLVASAAATLNPGGLLAIQEFMLDDNLQGPAHAALFSLNMLVGTTGGQAYTESAIRTMMHTAGVTNIRRLSVALPSACRILVGEVGR